MTKERSPSSISNAYPIFAQQDNANPRGVISKKFVRENWHHKTSFQLGFLYLLFALKHNSNRNK